MLSSLMPAMYVAQGRKSNNHSREFGDPVVGTISQFDRTVL